MLSTVEHAQDTEQSTLSNAYSPPWRRTPTTAMDSDFFWHSLGGGAIVAAALTFSRLLLEYGFRGGERRLEHAERRHGQQRDAAARLERLLQDRLAGRARPPERFETAGPA